MTQYIEKHKTLLVVTGGDEKLSETVQRMLFSVGYAWTGDAAQTLRHTEQFAVTNAWVGERKTNGRLYWGGDDKGNYEVRFDARTPEGLAALGHYLYTGEGVPTARPSFDLVAEGGTTWKCTWDEKGENLRVEEGGRTYEFPRADVDRILTAAKGFAVAVTSSDEIWVAPRHLNIGCQRFAAFRIIEALEQNMPKASA